MRRDFQRILAAAFGIVFSIGPVLNSAGAQQPRQAPPPTRTAKASPTVQAAEAHPLTAALRIAKTSRAALKDVDDYQCRFTKRDVVKGRVCQHTATVKFREKPMSVYMHFHGKDEGREVLYVAGQNQGKLLAHEARGFKSLVGTVSLAPNGAQAMSESRHPITSFGLKKLLDGAIRQWESEARFAASETKTQYYPNAKLGNVECQVIETSHPVRRRQFPFYMTRLYLDKKTKFPVRFEQYGFPTRANQKPPLIEEYTFWDIRPNLGLSERDFDRRNPTYGF